VLPIRRVTTVPTFLAVSALAVTVLFLPRLLPGVAEGIVQRLLNRELGPGYGISITGVTGPLDRQLGVDRVEIVGPDGDGTKPVLEIDELRIAYDIVTLFSANPVEALRSLSAGDVRVTLPDGTPDGSTPPETGPPDQGDRDRGDTTAVEEGLYAFLERLAPTTEISVPLTVTGPPVFDEIDSVFLYIHDRRLELDITAHNYTLTGTIASAPREAYLLLQGPGVSVSAGVTASDITATGTIDPRQLPMEPLFESGTFAVTKELDQSETPLSSIWNMVWNAARGDYSQLNGINGNLTISRIPTPVEVVLEEGYLDFEIVDSTAHIALRVDGGAVGTIVMDGLRIPLEDPLAGRPGEITVRIPEGATVSSSLLPRPARNALEQAGIIRLTENDRTVLLPQIDLTAATDPEGIVSVYGTVRKNDTFRLDLEALADIPKRRITIQTGHVRWADGRWVVTGRFSGTVLPGEPMQESAVTARIGVSDASAPDTNLTADLEYTQGVLTVLQGHVAHAGMEATLDRPMTITPAGGGVSIADAVLSVAGGTVSLSGRLERSSFSAEATVEQVTLEELLRGGGDPTVGGTLSGGLVGSGTYSSPRFEGSFKVDNLSAYGESGYAAVTVEQDETSLTIPRGDIRLGSLLRGEFTGRLPIVIGGQGVDLLPLRNASFDGDFSSDRIDRLFSGDSDTVVPEGKLTTRVALPEGTGRVNLRSVFQPALQEEIPTGSPAGFGYERLELTAEITDPRRDGLKASVLLRADDRNLFEGTGEVGLPHFPWKATAHGELPLEFMAPFLPGLAALTGSVEVSVSGDGTGTSASVTGTAVLRNGEVRPAGSVPAITGLEGVIRFDRKQFTSRTLRGEMGLAPFSATVSGNFGDGNLPGEIEATLSGTNLLLVSSPSIRARGDADIRLRGQPGRGYDLTGTVVLQSGTYSRDVPLIDFDTVPRIDADTTQLFSVPGPLGRQVRLNVRILATRSVRVENNIYSGPFSTDLTLRGTLEIPQPQGRIFTDRGRLTLPLTTVNVENAVLRFPQDRPFSPDIQARGVARLRNYQLYATVTGTLPDVEVDISSTPSLPQSDALVLLTTGFVPQELTGSGNRVALAVGSRLGTQFIRSLIGTAGGAGGADLADRVDVVIGEGVTESGAETIEIEFRLTEEDSWFLVFRRDRYDRYNMDLAWRFWLD
jgi:hypothetical protein